MLDQDPAERAKMEEFFSHPPASSIGPKTPTPAASPATAASSPTPTPLPYVRNQMVWLDVRSITAKRDINNAFADRAIKIAVEYGTVGKAAVPANLEVVFLAANPLGGSLAVASAKRQPILAEPPGLAQNPDGSPQIQPIEFFYDNVSSRYGAGVKLGSWVVRIVSPDGGTILAVKASDGALENTATDPATWQALVRTAVWNPPAPAGPAVP